MMPAFFHFQYILNRSFNNCIEFYWHQISCSWNMKGEGEKGGESDWPPPPSPQKKTTLKKPSYIRVMLHFAVYICPSKLIFIAYILSTYAAFKSMYFVLLSYFLQYVFCPLKYFLLYIFYPVPRQRCMNFSQNF